MQAITTIGLDIAKSVFQVHGIDAEGKVPDVKCALRPIYGLNSPEVGPVGKISEPRFPELGKHSSRQECLSWCCSYVLRSAA